MLHNNQRHFVLSMFLVASTVSWCGCRSLPGRNLFTRNSEPSADILAGTGPSTTYPTPPSISATPQAIASVAGGTSAPTNIDLGSPETSVASATTPAASSPTAQVAGFGSTPGYAAPATNYAAANANGFPSQGAAHPGGVKTNPKYGMPESMKKTDPVSGSLAGGSTTKTSPYTFGSKAFSPKSSPEPPSASPANLAASAPATSYGASVYNLPAQMNSKTGVGGSGSVEPAESGGGFTLPETLAVAQPASPAQESAVGFPTATAAITPPSISPSASLPEIQQNTKRLNGSVANVSAAAAPDFSTANATETTTAAPPSSAASVSFSDKGVVGGVSQSGYSPGSTANTSGYPSPKSAPATSGSFYR